LDTNVLLHDPYSLHRFADNHVWIPVDVLSELDRFKNEQSDRGASARAVHRTLSTLFGEHAGEIREGVPTPGGGSLRLAVFDLTGDARATAALRRFIRIFPDMERVDHRILATALLVGEAEPGAPAVLVSKDINLQLKARAAGLRCEDYLNDKVEAADVEGYDLRNVEVHPHELQRFASSGEIFLDDARTAGLVTNEYVLLTAGDRKTIPARWCRERGFRHLHLPAEGLHIPRGASLRPVNLGQQCLLDALLDPDVTLVTCYGQAGTGKTLLAVAAGLHAVFARQYNGVTVSRPVVAMGDTLGFLPGTLDEKMRPWLQPIYDAFDLLMPMPGLAHGPEAPGANSPRAARKQQKRQKHPGADPHSTHGGHSPNGGHASHGGAGSGGVARRPWEHLIEQGVVEIEALCYIRGRSIPRRFFVLDEAQQLTPLEAKTLVTRMSRGSKLVLVGDPGQIDNPYVDSRSNGLVFTRNRLKDNPITAHVSLSKGERSPLAELGARLM
jgi:PhoH-like ATPase